MYRLTTNNVEPEPRGAHAEHSTAPTARSVPVRRIPAADAEIDTMAVAVTCYKCSSGPSTAQVQL